MHRPAKYPQGEGLSSSTRLWKKPLGRFPFFLRWYEEQVKRVGEGSALTYPATVTLHTQRLGRQINTLTYTPDVRTL